MDDENNNLTIGVGVTRDVAIQCNLKKSLFGGVYEMDAIPPAKAKTTLTTTSRKVDAAEEAPLWTHRKLVSSSAADVTTTPSTVDEHEARTTDSNFSPLASSGVCGVSHILKGQMSSATLLSPSQREVRPMAGGFGEAIQIDRQYRGDLAELAGSRFTSHSNTSFLPNSRSVSPQAMRHGTHMNGSPFQCKSSSPPTLASHASILSRDTQAPSNRACRGAFSGDHPEDRGHKRVGNDDIKRVHHVMHDSEYFRRETSPPAAQYGIPPPMSPLRGSSSNIYHPSATHYIDDPIPINHLPNDASISPVLVPPSRAYSPDMSRAGSRASNLTNASNSVIRKTKRFGIDIRNNRVDGPDVSLPVTPPPDYHDEYRKENSTSRNSRYSRTSERPRSRLYNHVIVKEDKGNRKEIRYGGGQSPSPAELLIGRRSTSPDRHVAAIMSRGRSPTLRARSGTRNHETIEETISISSADEGTARHPLLQESHVRLASSRARSPVVAYSLAKGERISPVSRERDVTSVVKNIDMKGDEIEYENVRSRPGSQNSSYHSPQHPAAFSKRFASPTAEMRYPLVEQNIGNETDYARNAYTFDRRYLNDRKVKRRNPSLEENERPAFNDDGLNGPNLAPILGRHEKCASSQHIGPPVSSYSSHMYRKYNPNVSSASMSLSRAPRSVSFNRPAEASSYETHKVSGLGSAANSPNSSSESETERMRLHLPRNTPIGSSSQVTRDPVVLYIPAISHHYKPDSEADNRLTSILRTQSMSGATSRRPQVYLNSSRDSEVRRDKYKKGFHSEKDTIEEIDYSAEGCVQHGPKGARIFGRGAAGPVAKVGDSRPPSRAASVEGTGRNSITSHPTGYYPAEVHDKLVPLREGSSHGHAKLLSAADKKRSLSTTALVERRKSLPKDSKFSWLPKMKFRVKSKTPGAN